MGPIGSSKTSGSKYQSRLCNVQGEGRRHLRSSGSLRSRLYVLCSYTSLPFTESKVLQCIRQEIWEELLIRVRNGKIWRVGADYFIWRNSPQWVRTSWLTRLLDHTRRTTVGRTSLGEWSARLRDLYMTTDIVLTTDRHPCPRWDSIPQSQQAGADY